MKLLEGGYLVDELRAGGFSAQKLKLEMRCCKGIGATHAKWSPVATATYRLLPQISFKQEVTGDLAHQLQAMCPMGVFDVEDLGGKARAKVAHQRKCTVCRECVREQEWKERVKLERKVDHFICKWRLLAASVSMCPLTCTAG